MEASFEPASEPALPGNLMGVESRPADPEPEAEPDISERTETEQDDPTAPIEAFERTAPPNNDLDDFLFQPEPVVTAWSSMAVLAEPAIEPVAAPPERADIVQQARPGEPPLPPMLFVAEPKAAEVDARPPEAEDLPAAAPGPALEPTAPQVPLELSVEFVPAPEAPVSAAAEPPPSPDAASVSPPAAAAPMEPIPPARGEPPASERVWARSGSEDPLAAIMALTDEEKIALFG